MNQNSSVQIGPQDQIYDSGISFLDIFIFLKRSYKLIALMGILGVAVSFIYILILPKQYQAIAQIQMAQITVSKNSKSSLINIEEPASLISRLSYPTSYTA
jgi:uncharacterized protein involved in exopolysaccharide biosynthesis